MRIFTAQRTFPLLWAYPFFLTGIKFLAKTVPSVKTDKNRRFSGIFCGKKAFFNLFL